MNTCRSRVSAPIVLSGTCGTGSAMVDVRRSFRRACSVGSQRWKVLWAIRGVRVGARMSHGPRLPSASRLPAGDADGRDRGYQQSSLSTRVAKKNTLRPRASRTRCASQREVTASQRLRLVSAAPNRAATRGCNAVSAVEHRRSRGRTVPRATQACRGRGRATWRRLRQCELSTREHSGTIGYSFDNKLVAEIGKRHLACH